MSQSAQAIDWQRRCPTVPSISRGYQTTRTTSIAIESPRKPDAEYSRLHSCRTRFQ
jgi:hypothetical protein